MLILRDGSRRFGKLQSCVGDRCHLDGQQVLREQIEWIGLKDPETVPPAVRDATADEVHLRDRTVHSGALVGISAGEVLTERRAFDRPGVAWIHLVAIGTDADGEADGPKRLGAPSDSSPSEPPPSESPQPQSPPPGDWSIEDPPPTKPKIDPPPPKPRDEPPPGRPPDPPPPSDRPTGDLWIGHVHADERRTFTDDGGGGFHHYSAKLLVRLRESPRPALAVRDAKSPSGIRIAGHAFALNNEGTRVEVGYDNSIGCSDRAATSFSDEVNSGSGGYLVYRTVDAPVHQTFPGRGDVEVPKEGLYKLSFRPGEQWTPCDPGPWLFKFGLGQSYVVIGDDSRDPQANERRLTRNRSRMTGSYTRVDPLPDGGSDRLEVRWDICRAGSEGCTMAPPDFDVDPCGDLAKLRAPMDLLQDQRNALANELDVLDSRFDQLQEEMESHRLDFEQTMRDCKLWDMAVMLMEILIKGGASKTPVTETEIAELATRKALIKFKSILTKIQSGNPTWAIPDIQGVEANSATWKYLMERLQQTRENDLETMRRKLEKCAGSTPMTSYETYKGAQAFIDSFGKFTALLPEIQTKLNQLVQKDLELWNEWQKYYRDCLEWAECKELDPSVCDPPPPELAPR